MGHRMISSIFKFGMVMSRDKSEYANVLMRFSFYSPHTVIKSYGFGTT